MYDLHFTLCLEYEGRYEGKAMRLWRVDIVSSPTERLVTGVGRYEGSIEASKKRVYCSWRSPLRRRAPEERRRHGPCSSAKPPRPSEWVSMPVLWARGYHAPDVRLVRSACGASRWFISVSERLSSFLSLCVNSVSFLLLHGVYSADIFLRWVRAVRADKPAWLLRLKSTNDWMIFPTS